MVGTTFNPAQPRRATKTVESWLLRPCCNPRLHFRFYRACRTRAKPVVVLEIPRAFGRPVQFQGDRAVSAFGSYRQKLKNHPADRERTRVFDTTPFEELARLSSEWIPTLCSSLLDYPSYFDLLEQPLPSDRDKILARLRDDRMIAPDQAGGWDITNLGAILFAKSLDAFKGLGRKAVRVIVYEGKGRLITVREQVGHKGYASGFEGLIEFV